MRLILASSRDGILACGPRDDMRWTGSDDKRVFRLLTQVGGVLAAGRTTFEQMPYLKGRRLRCLSRRPGMVREALPPLSFRKADELAPQDLVYADATMTLGQFQHAHPDGWLIGGPTVAHEALDANLVSQVFMCRAPVDLMAYPFEDRPILDHVTGRLRDGPQWHLSQRIQVGETEVECWTNGERP